MSEGDRTERRGPSAKQPPRLALLVESPAEPFVVPLMRGQPLTVGRAAPADVIVDEPSLSRRHAQFAWREAGVHFEDLGSTNGSTRHGQGVLQAILLPGDAVQLGDLTVRIHTLHASSSAPLLEAEREFERSLRQRLSSEERCALALIRNPLKDEGIDLWGPRVRALLSGSERLGVYQTNWLVVASDDVSDLEGRLALAVSQHRLRAAVVSYPQDAATVDEMLARAHRLLELSSEAEPLTTARRYPHDIASARVLGDRMKTIYAQIDRVAPTRAPVLLFGETGVGKELLARAVHEQSERRAGPWRALNCAAIPATLQESTLFGYEKGAFTGAEQRTPGIFEQAHGGTVFLDEVGELPLETQAALLRTLETLSVLRVGSTSEIAVDVRVVSATHRNLEEEVRQGRFRQDLLYRLNMVKIDVPPLRERPDEIVPLAQVFLQNSDGDRRLSGQAQDRLQKHSWPGNVRELRNVVERAAIMSLTPEIQVTDLALSSSPRPRAASNGGPLKAQVRAFEAGLILEALEACGFNKTRAAEKLSVPVRTLAHKIQVLELKDEIARRQGAA